MEEEVHSKAEGSGDEVEAQHRDEAEPELSDHELGGAEVVGDQGASSSPPGSGTEARKVRRPIPAWPLVYYRASSDDSSAEGDVLWPIFRYEREGSEERYRVRPFIFSKHNHLATGDWDIDVLWPLIHNSRTRDDDGCVARFDIRPWIYNLARRYNAEGLLQQTTLSALFCLVNYHADSSSLRITVHPWIIQFLREIETLESNSRSKSEVSYPFGYYTEEPAEEYFESFRILELDSDEEEIEEIEENNKGKERESDEVQDNSAAERVRPTQTHLKLLGGLVEYLRNSERLFFTLRPRLLNYDRNKLERSITMSTLAGLARYSASSCQHHPTATITNSRLVPFFFRQAVSVPELPKPKDLLEYTVILPLYVHVKHENTTRLHVWPLMGLQTFDDGKITEYSTMYPFLRFTVLDSSSSENKGYRIDAPWPFIHYQRGPGRSVSHRIFPVYRYHSSVESRADGTHLHSSRGNLLLFYWHNQYSTSLGDPSSSSSSSSAALTSSPGSPEFSCLVGVFPILRRSLASDSESLTIIPILNYSNEFQFVEEQVMEEEEEIVEVVKIVMVDDEPSDDSDSDDSSCDSDSDTSKEELSEEELETDDDSDAEINSSPSKHNRAKGKERSRTQAKKKQKAVKKKTLETRKVMVQRIRRSKKEKASVFLPLLLSYYAKDDIAQRTLFLSPLICRGTTEATQGDGWLLVMPGYFSKREGGGFAAGGSEKRLLLPFYYCSMSVNRRTLVLPFYANSHNIVTGSYFMMRGSWFKHHNAITGASNWWGCVPFPFWICDSDNFYAWMIFPFYGIFRDRSNNSMPGSYVEAFTPLYYRINCQPNNPTLESRSRLTFFVPLLWFTWETMRDRGMISFILPLGVLFGARHEEYNFERFAIILPLLMGWVSTRSASQRFQLLFPFYFRYRDSTRHSVGVLPWFYYGHNLLTSDRRLVLSPFIVDDDHVASNGSRRQWVFPLFYRSYSPQHTRFVSPLAIYNKNKDTGGSLILTPVLFDYFEPTRGPQGERYQYLMPLFFRRLWDNENEQTLLLPIYYRYHFKDSTTNAVYDTTAVAPFYLGTTEVAADGSLTYSRHLLFFPLFRRIYSPITDFISYDALWPLFHYSRDPTSFNLRILPLLWTYEDQTARGKQLTHARVIFPLYYSFELANQRRITAFFPFWFKLEQPGFGSVTLGSFGLLPPYFYRRVDENNETRSLQLWPLMGYHKDGNKIGLRLLWPLLSYNSDKDAGWTYYRFLMFLHTSTKTPSERTSFTSLLPLWFHHNKATINPATGNQSATVRDVSLLLHYYEVSAYVREFALGWVLHPTLSLFYFRRTANSLLHRLLGLYQYKWSSAGNSELAMLWFPHPSASLILLRKEITHTLAYAFALFHYMRDKGSGNYRLSFLWALHPALACAAITKEEGRMRHHVFPFYHFSDDRKSNIYSVSFLYLLFPTLALGQWRRCTDMLRHYLMPLYFYKNDLKQKERQISLLWLFAPQLALARWKKSTAETTAYLSGLCHYRSHNESVEWSLLYPLVFPKILGLIRYSRAKLRNQLVHYAAPFYYYRSEPQLRRFALLYLLHPALSLFYYEKKEPLGNHSVKHRLAPLYSYSWSGTPQGKTNRLRFSLGCLLPFLSLFSYTREGENVSHGIPLIYNYSSTPFGTTLKFFCGLFSHTSKEGENSHHMWPFYSYSFNLNTGALRFSALFGTLLYAWSKHHMFLRLWPLFRYERRDNDPTATSSWRQLSLLWAFHPAFSIFRYFSSATKTFSRLWPLFHFQKDKNLQQRRLCMAYVAPGLSLIRHQRQGDELENWVWPLVRATSLAKSGKRTVDALWLTSKPRLSLLHFERDENQLQIWPLYSHAFNPITQEKRLRLLLTAVQYQSTPTSYDLKVLWRMMRVTKEDDGSYSACINPLIYHEHSPTAGSWTAFLGGLVAREISPAGQSKMSYLWLF